MVAVVVPSPLGCVPSFLVVAQRVRRSHWLYGMCVHWFVRVVGPAETSTARSAFPYQIDLSFLPTTRSPYLSLVPAAFLPTSCNSMPAIMKLNLTLHHLLLPVLVLSLC